jgi:tryptophan 2,3-dioxygenase
MPSYAEYLKVDELLALQRPLSEGPEHDEMLFIVIHQVYELWFKEILHELDYLNGLLSRNDGARARHTLKRILTILKVMVAQLDILETMTPLEFLSFRDRLESGSGFQSGQFRELEAVLGIRSTHTQPGAAGERLAAARNRRSLWDSYLRYLETQGYAVPSDALERDVTVPIEPSPAVQEVLLTVYEHDGGAAQVTERLVDLDEGLQEWRYRHVKMVERTIGDKPGTGGSMGAKYLRSTLSQPVFPDLWAVRSRL